MPRPITSRELDQQDHDQTVAFAVEKARQSYDPALGMAWGDFLNQTIHTEVRAMERARKRAKPKRGRLVRLDDVADDLADPRAEAAFGASLLLKDALRVAMRDLSRAERIAILTLIAEDAGHLAQPTRNVRSKALSKLRIVPAR